MLQIDFASYFSADCCGRSRVQCTRELEEQCPLQEGEQQFPQPSGFIDVALVSLRRHADMF